MAVTSGQLRALFAGARFGVQYVSGLDTINNMITNTSYDIERSADEYWCEAVRISKDYDINNIISISLSFNNNGIHITVPMHLVKQLCIISRDKYYTIIHMTPSLFFKHDDNYSIPLITLPNKTLSFKIDSNVPILYDLIGRYTYHNTEPRKKLALEEHKIITNIYEKVTMQDGIIKNIPMDGTMSGFFVSTCQEPTRIRLYLNKKIFWDYDKNFIQYAGQLIYSKLQTQETHQQYLYWLPFNPHKKWNDTCVDYLFGPPQSRIVEIGVDGCDCDIYYLTHKKYIISQ